MIMAIKRINESPRITDTILLEISCPDATGCLSGNPYKVDRVTVFYVERDFLGQNFGEYTKQATPEPLLIKLSDAEEAYCDDPTEATLSEVEKVRAEIESASQKSTFYFKDRVAVKTLGSEGFPAWLSSDTENSPLSQAEDENGDPILGKFTYEWSPNGSAREGDYFLCWTWTPLPAGDKLSAHEPFVLEGDPSAVLSVPTHRTPEGKYETLLERYTPEMYKSRLSNNDITPETLDRLNRSVARGFTFVEDMANQIIDLFDANALHESMLMYLSNLFALKLKSNDPTLWRRQIKEAIPLFKKKGTLPGLKAAFAQAGMTLDKFTQYWQVVSPFTWVESFLVKDSPTFTLGKTNVEAKNDDNFGVWVRRAGEASYVQVSNDYVEFGSPNGLDVTATWVGDMLSTSPVELFEGDTLKVKYQYKAISGTTDQQIEDYLQTLPLADQRDELDQQYPPKNWNVRLVAEEDPMFSVLIPVRHPFAEPLIFGYVRTEFPYGENIYNMEEYNGSTRPSYNPCDIDKEFVDPCGACLSSKYSVDISVEELSNDRMLEAQEILREFVPFEAQIHSINFAGDVNEFVQPPVESVESLVTIDRTQIILSGNANMIFHRMMEKGLGDWAVMRDDLAEENTVLSNKSGTAYNDKAAFVAPDVRLRSLGVMPLSHVLEVLAPSPNAGTYTLSDVQGNTANLSSAAVEPLDQTGFTFRLSNVLYSTSTASLTQDDRVGLSDDEADFAEIGVKTLWDVENTADYTGGAWKVMIPAYSATPYEIEDVINGVLYLVGSATLPTSDTSGVTYTLLTDLDDEVAESDTGSLAVERRALVDLNDSYLEDVNEVVAVGDYLVYAGDEYVVTGINGSDFYVADYTGGDASGVGVQIRRRLADNEVGYFGYRGLRLTTESDHEAGLGMINGTNAPTGDQKDDSHFKENYLFEIDGEFYKISQIDGDEVVLSGRDQNWTTLAAGGTAVTYNVIHFPAKEVNVGFTVFDALNRNGKDPVIREIESTVDNNVAIVALSTPSGVQENVSQEENVSFTIETRSGESYEGAL